MKSQEDAEAIVASMSIDERIDRALSVTTLLCNLRDLKAALNHASDKLASQPHFNMEKAKKIGAAMADAAEGTGRTPMETLATALQMAAMVVERTEPNIMLALDILLPDGQPKPRVRRTIVRKRR